MAVDTPRISRSPFGRTADGREIERLELVGAGGVEMSVLGYGGVIQSLRAPDRDGRLADVVLGYDDLAGYEGDTSSQGILVGRFANRIRDGVFTLDGERYQLPRNDGRHHLHGGELGFGKRVWEASPFQDGDAVGVELAYESPDGEEGYPGTVEVRVRYTLRADNTLSIEYRAVTDRPTIVNLTQHAYFNLAGEGAGPEAMLDHLLQVHAERYTPVDDTLIPTGELAPVEGTPLDFRDPTRIGDRIDAEHEQIRLAGGYDHNYVVSRSGEGLVPAARLLDPRSGRGLEVRTTEPGMQFYSGNFLKGVPGKGGRPYPWRAALCLETQHFPDTPNQPAFPSCVLRPGEEFVSRTDLAFSAK